MTLKVGVDRGRCCGSGLCWGIAPEFFDVDDEGIVVLLRDTANESLRGMLTTAARTCPTGSIYLEDV